MPFVTKCQLLAILRFKRLSRKHTKDVANHLPYGPKHRERSQAPEPHPQILSPEELEPLDGPSGILRPPFPTYFATLANMENLVISSLDAIHIGVAPNQRQTSTLSDLQQSKRAGLCLPERQGPCCKPLKGDLLLLATLTTKWNVASVSSYVPAGTPRYT